MIRSQRRHLANRIAKRRYRIHSYVKHIGRLRKNNMSCDCMMCRYDRQGTSNSKKFIQAKNWTRKIDNDLISAALMSEKSLAKDWDKPEEEEAWKNL